MSIHPFGNFMRCFLVAGIVSLIAVAARADITLETGNNASSPLNNALHQQVCAEVPNPFHTTDKTCFSFAATGVQLPEFSSTWLGWSSWVVSAILKGEIYEVDPVAGSTIKDRHKTTPDQDKKWVAYMRSVRVGVVDGYSVVRHNCRTFSQWEFRDAPLHW